VNTTGPQYWFGFHPYQRTFLSAGDEAYLALGCGSEDRTLLIPFAALDPLVDGLHRTERESRLYWHVRIDRAKARYVLRRRKGFESVDLARYLL
jgi:hypothetical protein